ncbi:MAG TPA: ATP-dependent sacrificial sulfur transferase LarE [Methanoregulaceae archaeon]|nr:ATP-dependent sacrificial sulfur transferase LarE [Methanoregulaceae archaeon]
MGREEKLDALKSYIADKGSMLISYSGGVDSSLLAAVATAVLGSNSRGVLLDSPVVPRRILCDAVACARDLGLNLEIIPVSLLENDQFRKNPTERCYFCKKLSAKILKEKAKELHMACIADGINVSDLGEHRPGLDASNEEGFVHPFIETGITKEDIREIARDLGYTFWNKPSAACLSSRIPYGQEITKEDLRMIEEAEDFLSEKGFSQFRVRNHGGVARIEIIPVEFETLMRLRAEVSGNLKKMGFSYVTVDLDGYRSGSMDEIL